MPSFRVHQAVPAPAKTARWLSALLLQPIDAARIENPPALELRGLGGDIAGVCMAHDHAPDGRVMLSHRALLWHPQAIVITYLHEAAHRLLRWQLGDDPHDAAFFALLHCFLKRCDAGGVTVRADLSLDLYALSDVPPVLSGEPDGGVGQAITWALSVSRELAQTDLSAEALAVEIRIRYEAWLALLDQRPVQVARAQAAVTARVQAVAVLREKLFVRNLLVVGLSTLVIAMFILMIKGS
jgi:hypothetical protein